MNSIKRIRIVKYFLSLIFLGLLIYLFLLQTVYSKKYEHQAECQHGVKIPLLAERGKIFDARYRPLVYNQLCASIRILPQYVRNKDSVADILASYKLKSRPDILNELTNKNSLYWFTKDLDYQTGNKLKKEVCKKRFDNSIVVADNIKRIYPFGHSLGSVIGFMGEEQGLAGLEFAYDAVLRGKPGWILLQKDAIGNNYYWPSYPMQSPQNGKDIILTIDLDIQDIVYKNLALFVDSFQAIRGSVIVMDAQSGAILALADYPDFDPQNFSDYSSNLWKSIPINDEFEPGSVYKLLICATALESSNREVLLSQQYNVSSGFITISGKKIKDVHNNGIIAFDEIFIKSSNIGVSLLSQMLTPEDFYLTERKFGFGLPTGIELPGEASGFIDPPSRLTALRFANNAFGQGIRATLIQLSMAYLSIAQDGLLLKPYIIKNIVDNNKIIYKGEKKNIRRVLDINTAQKIKEILAQVVIRGTGQAAKLDGYQVCGKTGTAQKLEPDGKYSAKKSIMIFIGFFPKENPQYLISILIDEPKISRFAGEVTCPMFKRIATKILELNSPKQINNNQNLVLR